VVLRSRGFLPKPIRELLKDYRAQRRRRMNEQPDP
jgi:hypothetical protein